MPAQEGLKYMRAGWLQPVDEFLRNPALTAPDYNWNDFLEKTRDAMVIEGKIIGSGHVVGPVRGNLGGRDRFGDLLQRRALDSPWHAIMNSAEPASVPVSVRHFTHQNIVTRIAFLIIPGML